MPLPRQCPLSLPPPAASPAHSAATSARSVGSAPTDTRTIQRPSSIAGVRYAAPERLTRSAQPSVCASSASPVQPRRLVPDAHRLQRHRRQHPPARRRAHLLGQPARVRQVAPQPGLQPAHALARGCRNHSFSARNRRPSGMPQSRRFFTCAVGRRSAGSSGWCDITRTRCSRVAHVVERAVERARRATCAGSAPASRPASTPSHIHRHSGRIIAEPAIAASTCSQSPCRARDVGDRRDRVDGGGGRRAGRGDDGARAAARGEVGRDHRRRARPAASRSAASCGTSRTFSRPKPASSAAFSTELWLCAEA